MTLFDGIRSGERDLGKGQIHLVAMPSFETPFSASTTVSPTAYRPEYTPSQLASSYVGRDLVDIHSVKDGFRPHSFGDDNLFFRIWFEPYIIDAGFIVEDKIYEIKIWNAFFSSIANLTAISSITPTGTSLDSPSLPDAIAKFGDLTMDMTVLKAGPPSQSSSYTFTVDGTDYIAVITGLRVLSFAHEPDYSQGVKMNLVFETAIATNKYYQEQRRPLMDRMLVNISLSTWEEGLAAQKLKHLMKYGHDRVFGIPIYTEHGYPSQDVNGQTVIQCSNDLQYHWFLNNQCTYVVLIQFDNQLAEIKELSSVGSNSITLARAVTETFEWKKTMVFPVVLSTVKDLSFDSETDSILGVDVGFQEYRASE